MSARTSTPGRLVPFDLDRLASGDAMAIVTTPEGRTVVGRLLTEEMWVDTGPTVELAANHKANLARAHKHSLAVLFSGGLRVLGSNDDQAIAKMVEAGFLDPDHDQDTHRRQLKRWRAKYRAIFGSDKSQGSD